MLDFAPLAVRWPCLLSCKGIRPLLSLPVCAAAAVPEPVQNANTLPRNKTAGRSTYRPESFDEMVTDASSALVEAMEAGLSELEVEFPPLPSSVDSYKGASDDYIDANVRLAISGAVKIAKKTNKRVHILVPDRTEYNRSYKLAKNSLDLADGMVTMGYLNEGRRGFMGGLSKLFGNADNADDNPGEAAGRAEVFICVNASTVELKDIERYAKEYAKGKTLVLWNMELDTLRADLGLLAFPPKDLQYRFLCRFTPVFYIRQRDYSKSVAVAPFLINYSGALFREYPGPWQVLLRQDNAMYACVAEREERYNLGEVKKQLMQSMGLDTEEVGSALAFLRTGYKTSTWWEDAKDKEESNNWRR
eukprot:jgi/Astpho2/7815/fgenesh1_pm.00117_%23_11_t